MVTPTLLDRFKTVLPYIGSCLFHLAMIAILIGFGIYTATKEPQTVEVSIAYITPSPPAQPAASAPPAKPVLKREGVMPVKRTKPMEAINPIQTETAPITTASPHPATPPVHSTNTEARDATTSREYTLTLLAWLERHKRYPRQAKISQMEGKAMLSFRINQKGTVLDYKITQSTGHYVLDDAVIKMINDANPVPPPPNPLAIDAFNFNVPVSFKLH